MGRNKQRPWSKQHTEEVHLGSERKPIARPELWSAPPAPLRSAESVDCATLSSVVFYLQ